jgi:3'(2'), 5'-bisphosphate nucleotidase
MRAVEEAVCLARTMQDDATAAAFITKADASPVTVTDFAIQAVIAARLAREFPHDSVVAEEDASALRAESTGTSNRVTKIVQQVIPDATVSQVLDWIDSRGGESSWRFWTLDPIDGTKGLLGGRQYAIALALIANGRLQTA